jgi:pilus assembly protein CpaF
MTSGILDPKIEEEIRKEFLARIQGKDFLRFPRSDRRIITGRMVRDITDSKNIILSRDELEAVSSRFDEDSFDMGPISLLLRDPEITEIMVNGPHSIFIEKQGKITREPVHFKDSSHIKNIVDKILGPLGLRIDEANPMVDARLGDGSRINAAISPVSKSDIVVTIRKFKDDIKNMEQLLEAGSLSREMSGFLSDCVRRKLNILVSGGTGTGKTTLLNILSENIQGDERIITIEETLELEFAQDNMVRLEARPANLEGRGEVTIRDLVRNALRMRPDRLIVGEIRGQEAVDVMQAMNTGHSGSMTTIHANSPRDAVTRLETMLLISDSNIDPFTAERIIASSLDMIIQMKKLEGGHRMISRISEITYDRDAKRKENMLDIKDIASIEEPHDKVSTAVFTGYEPLFLEKGHV